MVRLWKSVLLGVAALWVAACPSQAMPGQGYAESLFGVRAGDRKYEVLAQQGWYECDKGNSQFDTLCFDQVRTLGETGTYRIKFLDGLAFSSEFRIPNPNAFEKMLGQLGNFHNGEMILVSFQTKNVEIDVIKALHELGEDEASKRFNRFLEGDARSELLSISVVPLTPQSGGASRFQNSNAYLEALPPGGVILRLWRLNHNIRAGFSGATILSLRLPLSDRAILFPQYCTDECRGWELPRLASE